MDRKKLYWIGAGVVIALVLVLILSITSRKRDELPPQSSNTSTLTIAPAKPIAKPKSDNGFDIVRVAPTGEAVIAGRGTPDADVEVYAGDVLIGRTKADKRGEWVLTPEKPLPPGNQELRIVEKNADGPKNLDSTVIVAVPEKPSEPTVALKVDPGAGSQLLQGPPVPSGGLSVVKVDYNDKGEVEISGVGPKDSTIRVYIDNQLVGEAKVDVDGKWQVVPATPISSGDHDVRVDQVDPNGKVLARVEVGFTRVADSHQPLQDGQYQVKRGNNLWTIAKRTYGKGTQYAVIFQANAAIIKDPDLIYPGQILILPK